MAASPKAPRRSSRAPLALALVALAGVAACAWSASALTGVARLDKLATGFVAHAVDAKVGRRGNWGRRAAARARACRAADPVPPPLLPRSPP
jgi:hypothetical protein